MKLIIMCPRCNYEIEEALAPAPPVQIERERRINELERALSRTRSALQDLHNGWPEKELYEPIAVTLKRAGELLGDES